MTGATSSADIFGLSLVMIGSETSTIQVRVDLSNNCNAIMLLRTTTFSTGWEFKESDDDSETKTTWMPVPAVPSVVHQDLQANKRYVTDRERYSIQNTGFANAYYLALD